jgi:hypothetical protein
LAVRRPGAIVAGAREIQRGESAAERGLLPPEMAASMDPEVASTVSHIWGTSAWWNKPGNKWDPSLQWVPGEELPDSVRGGNVGQDPNFFYMGMRDAPRSMVGTWTGAIQDPLGTVEGFLVPPLRGLLKVMETGMLSERFGGVMPETPFVSPPTTATPWQAEAKRREAAQQLGESEGYTLTLKRQKAQPTSDLNLMNQRQAADDWMRGTGIKLRVAQGSLANLPLPVLNDIWDNILKADAILGYELPDSLLPWPRITIGHAIQEKLRTGQGASYESQWRTYGR